jgi:hypothetical protein
LFLISNGKGLLIFFKPEFSTIEDDVRLSICFTEEVGKTENDASLEFPPVGDNCGKFWLIFDYSNGRKIQMKTQEGFVYF